MRPYLIVLPLFLGLAACKPNPAEVESLLQSRGLGATQASCIARELDMRLTREDWRTLAELAGDTMRSEEEWRDLTIGEAMDKLKKLNDAPLLSALLRTGLGCAVLGGDTEDKA